MKRGFSLWMVLFALPSPAFGDTPVATDLAVQGLSVVAYLSYENTAGDMTLRCNTFAAFRDDTLRIYRFFTMAHCVMNKGNTEVETGNWYIHFDPNGGAEKRYMRATLVAAGNPALGLDFAIFDVSFGAVAARDLPLLPFGARRMRLDERVLTLSSNGIEDGVPIVPHIGWVTDEALDSREIVEGVNWDQSVKLWLEITRGASGAPVISLEQNAVVGMLLGRFNNLTAVALPVERLLQFWRGVCTGTSPQYRQPGWRSGECVSQTGN